MDFLENNYIEFDNNNKEKYTYLIGKIKNTTEDLHKVFGIPIKIKGKYKWMFKTNNSKFSVHNRKGHIGWYLSSNTNDEIKIKKFVKFLSEARQTVHSLRSLHKSIPIYDKDSYQLKGKIALYTIPPKEPVKDIIIHKKKKKIPKRNKYGELVFKDFPDFRPNLTPKEVIQSGSFGGTYFRPILSGITGKYYKDVWKEFPSDWFDGLDVEKYVTSIKVLKDVNKYKVKMGGNLDMWESSGWITKIDPYGWFQWYCRFYLGRRTSDDERQIKRWLKSSGYNGRFRITLIQSIIRAKTKYNDYQTKQVIRQGLLHWAYELTKKDFYNYIKTKLVKYKSW